MINLQIREDRVYAPSFAVRQEAPEHTPCVTQLIEPVAFQQLPPDQRSGVARGQAYSAMPNALAFFCLYLFLPFLTWLSAEPAALLDALLVRLSRSVFDAAVAAFLPVVSLGDLLCVKALPAALLEGLPVLLERRTFDAALAACLPVCLGFAISSFSRIGTEARRSIEGMCR